MAAKIYIIKSSNFFSENYSEIIRDKFTDEIYEDVEYKQIFTFEHYMGTNFDQSFDSVEEIDEWLQRPIIEEIEL